MKHFAKKAMSFFLIVSLLICSVFIGTASAINFKPSDIDLAAQINNPANWHAKWSQFSVGSDGNLVINLDTWNEMYCTITGLKPNTTYRMNGAFKALKGQSSLISGEWGVAIAPASVEDGKVVDNTLITSGDHNLTIAQGSTGYIMNKEFTTTSETDYTLRLGFSGDQAYGGQITLFGWRLEEEGLSEELKTVTKTTTLTELKNAANWLKAENTSGITQKDSETIVFNGWYTADMPVYATLYLKPNTTYTFHADYTANNGNLAEIYSGDWGVLIVPASVADLDNGAPASFTASTLRAGALNSSSSHSHGAVYASATAQINETFTTTDETKYTLGIRVKGGTAAWACEDRVKMWGFSVKETVTQPSDAMDVAMSGKFEVGEKVAAIRAGDASKPQGLRVKSNIDETLLADAACGGYTVTEYGTLVAKKANLHDLDLTLDMVGNTTFKAKKGAAYVAASGIKKTYEQVNTSLIYTGVLIGISVPNYNATYSVRAYVCLKNAEGTELVVYGNTAEVSVLAVANTILSDSDASAADQSVAQSVVDAYNSHTASNS